MDRDTKKRYYLHAAPDGRFRLSDENGQQLPLCEVLSVFPDRTVYALRGAMGAGKTTFVKQLCEELGTQDVVNSPTFALVNVYDIPSRDGIGTEEVYHFDLYRLKNITEALDMGAQEYFESGMLCFIEWPDIAASLLPDNSVVIDFEVQNDGTRLLTIGELQC